MYICLMADNVGESFDLDFGSLSVLFTHGVYLKNMLGVLWNLPTFISIFLALSLFSW